MLLCYQSINHLPNINCCVRRVHTSHNKGDKNLVKFPAASIIPKAEITDNHELRDQANAVGIIGGLSVNSCLNFTEKLAKLELQNGKIELPFVICMDPTLCGETERVDDTKHGSIVEGLRRKRISLENYGVCCVVMPCHISHSNWYDEIKEGCCVPFLHMGECVAKELKEEKLRPIEIGSCLRIGVIATNSTSVARIFQEKLEKEGFEVVMPDKATMDHIVIPAMEALSKQDLEGAQNLFRIAIQILLVKAVNKIVVISDDLKQLLPSDDPLWTKCVDPIDALARSTLKYAQSVGEVNNKNGKLQTLPLTFSLITKNSSYLFKLMNTLYG